MHIELRLYYPFSEAFEAQLVPHPVTWKIVAVDLNWKNVLEVILVQTLLWPVPVLQH